MFAEKLLGWTGGEPIKQEIVIHYYTKCIDGVKTGFYVEKYSFASSMKKIED